MLYRHFFKAMSLALFGLMVIGAAQAAIEPHSSGRRGPGCRHLCAGNGYLFSDCGWDQILHSAVQRSRRLCSTLLRT